MGAKRYDLLGTGRVSFGPEGTIRLLFRASKDKALEVEKAAERRREERDSGGDLLASMAQRMNIQADRKEKDKAREQRRIMTDETKTGLLIDALKDGKALAMTNMLRYGEIWAEEEDLPSTWEAGLGGGADTELGLRASAGGMGREVSLATARQSKLRVAKKNSKY